MTIPMPLHDRLMKWRRVMDSGCWEWSGSQAFGGYGQISMKGNIPRRVHRVSYALYVGPIPDGMMVLHSCDNRLCFRPSHLYVGTHDDNMRDMVVRERHNALHGSRCPFAKLTEAQVVEMRDLFSSGVGKHDLAARYGVHWNNVNAIVKRRTWRHV